MKIRYFFSLVVFLFMISSPVYANVVTLQWDVNEDADYYVVYWGKIEGNPSQNSTNISSGTSFKVTVPNEYDYYFAVKAFNSYGNSSDFSDWVKVASSDGSNPSDPEIPDPETPNPIAPDPPYVPGPVVDPGIIPVPDPKSVPALPSSASIITDADSYPSIEVFNKKFEHIEWLSTGWYDYNDLSGVAHVATGDITGDGVNEIIIGFGRVESEENIPGGYFEIVADDYTHLAWGRIQWSEYNLLNGESWPTCGDLDGDGIDEIIVGLGVKGQGYFEVFKYNAGSVEHFAWGQVKWNEYNILIGETRPVCADLDADGSDEIIIGLGSKGGNSDVPAGKFEVFNSDLTHLSWSTVNWAEYNSMNGETWPAPGDLDGDGGVDMVVGLGVGGKGNLALFDFESGVSSQFDWINVDWEEYNLVSGETRPACGDIDNDSKDEIIVGFGPVAQGVDIPEGFFSVFDDDLTIIEWGQINHAEFNKLNGESIPSKGAVGNDDKIIIGLGSWDFQKDDDDDTSLIDTNNDLNGASKSTSEGCFINALF